MKCTTRNSTIAFVLVGLLLSVSVLLAKGPTDEVDAPRDAKGVLKERLALLKEIAELRRTAYEQGNEQLDTVLAADVELSEAEIELAATPAERVAIRE
jgi:hypothetical protein